MRLVLDGDGCAQATPTPFINAIFDREPLQHLMQGRTVLVGEAAHPTTPHALRSTNMAIMDAGACIFTENCCTTAMRGNTSSWRQTHPMVEYD